MQKITSFLIAVTLLVSPAVSLANTQSTPEKDAGVDLTAQFSEFTGGSVIDTELIGNTWYILYQDASEDSFVENELYAYDTTLRKVAVNLPQIRDIYTFNIKAIGSYFGSPTLTVGLYKETDADTYTLVTDKFFFPNQDFSYLWELPIPDSWVIHDVYYGHKSLMFDIEKKGSEGRFLYNYLWPDEVFLVSSFAQYEDFSMASTEFDEWVIKACTAQDASVRHCDWFRFGANKILAPLSGLPAGFVASQALPHTDGLDIGFIGTVGTQTAAAVVRPVSDEPGVVSTLGFYTKGITEVQDELLMPSVQKDSYNRTLVAFNGQLILSNDHDADSDGLSDEVEWSIGTDMNSADSDGDGYDDFTELARGFNPNGVCQFKSFEGPEFRYGRGYVPQEQHACYDEHARSELARRLGNNWKTAYAISPEKEADLIFAYIYGDYAIDELVNIIIKHASVDTASVYTATQ